MPPEKTDTVATMDIHETKDADVTEVDLSQNVGADILFEDDNNPPPVLQDLKAVLSASVNGLADASRAGTVQMEFKKTGSVTMARKYKFFQGRWFTSKPKQGGNVEDPNV